LNVVWSLGEAVDEAMNQLSAGAGHGLDDLYPLPWRQMGLTGGYNPVSGGKTGCDSHLAMVQPVQFNSLRMRTARFRIGNPNPGSPLVITG
jgi:hypothetical protein